MLTLFKAFKDEVVFKVLGFTGTCLLTVVVFDTVLVVVGVGLLETGVFFIGVLSKVLFLVVVFDTVLVVVGVGLLETGVFFIGVLSKVLFLVVTGFVYVFYCDYNSGFSLLSGLL